jgi:hypothetical protein
MPEKQKPIPKIVHIAAKAMNDPKSVSNADIKSMAARILDDQKNDPQPHRPVKRTSIVARLNAITKPSRAKR